MSKGLEALNRVRNKFIDFFHEDFPDFDILEQAITELKAIKETNPSEALKCVGVLKEEDCITTLVQGKALETIRQYILKAQEQEKTLKAVKNIVKSGDDLISTLNFDTYEEYCKDSYGHNYKLAREEFDSLKDVKDNE